MVIFNSYVSHYQRLLFCFLNGSYCTLNWYPTSLPEPELPELQGRGGDGHLPVPVRRPSRFEDRLPMATPRYQCTIRWVTIMQCPGKFCKFFSNVGYSWVSDNLYNYLILSIYIYTYVDQKLGTSPCYCRNPYRLSILLRDDSRHSRINERGQEHLYTWNEQCDWHWLKPSPEVTKKHILPEHAKVQEVWFSAQTSNFI